jgi:hypothetical protein
VTSEGTKVEKLEGTKVEKLEGTNVVTTEGAEGPRVSELADVGGPLIDERAPCVSITAITTPATMSVEEAYLRKQLTENRAENE